MDELIEKLNSGEITLDEYLSIAKTNTINGFENTENKKSETEKNNEISSFNRAFENTSEFANRPNLEESISVSDEEMDTYRDRGIQPMYGGDYVDARAWRQSNADQIANGTLKFLGKTATATVGVLAMLPGIVYGATQEDFTKIYDNDFQKALDRANESMDEALPNYVTKASQEYGFLKILGTTNFWANDLTSGMSFVAGALLTEALSAGMATPFVMAKAGSLVSKVARQLKKISYADDMGKIASRAKQASNLKIGDSLLRQSRQIVTGAGYESGVEARHFVDEAKENFIQEFAQIHGREPNEEELAGAMDEIYTTANGLFGINLALVSAANVVTLPKTFGPGLTKRLGLKDDLLKSSDSKWITKVDDLSEKRLQRIAKKKGVSVEDLKKDGYVNKFDGYTNLEKAYFYGKNTLSKSLTEGVWEEGLQNTFNGAALDYIDNSLLPESQEEVASYSESFMNSLKETYGGKNDGWKEMLIGAIIGGMGGPNIGAKKGESIWQGGMFDFKTPNKSESVQKLLDKAINNKATVSNINYAINSISANKKQDEALEDDDIFTAKMHEAQDFHAKVGNALETDTFEDYIEETSKSVESMTDEEFADSFGYKNMTKEEIASRKRETLERFKSKAQESKKAWELARRSNLINDPSIEGGLSFSLFLSDDIDIREGKMASELVEKLGQVFDSETMKEFVPFIEFQKENKALIDQLNEKTRKLEKLTEEELKANNNRTSKNIMDRGRELDALEKEIEAINKKIEKTFNEFSKDKGITMPYSKDSQGFKAAFDLFQLRQSQIEKTLGSEIYSRPDVDKLLKDLMKVSAYRESEITTANYFFTEEGQKSLQSQKDKLIELRSQDRVSLDLTLAELKMKMAKEEYKEAQEAAAEAYRIKSSRLFGEEVKLEKKTETEEDPDEPEITPDIEEFLSKNPLSNYGNLVNEEDFKNLFKAYLDFYNSLDSKSKKVFKENLKNLKEVAIRTYNIGKNSKGIKNVNVLEIPEFKAILDILEGSKESTGTNTSKSIVTKDNPLQTMEWVKSKEVEDLKSSVTNFDEGITMEIEAQEFDEDDSDYAKPKDSKGAVIKNSPVKVVKGIPELQPIMGQPNYKYAIKVMYNGIHIGYLNTPDKYVFGEKNEPFDPDNIEHLRILNKDFIDGKTDSTGRPMLSPKGKKFVSQYNLAKANFEMLLSKISPSKTNLTNKEVKEIFKINTNFSGYTETEGVNLDTISKMYDGKMLTDLTTLPADEGLPKKGVVIYMKTKTGASFYVYNPETKKVQKIKNTKNFSTLKIQFADSIELAITNKVNKIVLYNINGKDEFLAFEEPLTDYQGNVLKDLMNSVNSILEKIKETGEANYYYNNNDLFDVPVRLTYEGGSLYFKLQKTKDGKHYDLKLGNSNNKLDITLSTFNLEGQHVSTNYNPLRFGGIIFSPDIGEIKGKYGPIKNEEDLVKAINYRINSYVSNLETKKKSTDPEKSLNDSELDALASLSTAKGIKQIINVRGTFREEQLEEYLPTFVTTRAPNPLIVFTKNTGTFANKFTKALSDAINYKLNDPDTLNTLMSDLQTAYDELSSDDKNAYEKKFNNAIDKLSKELKKSFKESEPEVGEQVNEETANAIFTDNKEEKKPVNPNDPIDILGKFSTSEEESDVEESISFKKSRLLEILPDWITVSDLENIEEGLLSNTGFTYGLFLDSAIYLSKNAPKGTEYHEAFHAVFRVLLSDAQISKALKEASSKYGTPTKEELNYLRNKSAKYKSLSTNQLTELWLEEKMADGFMDYMNNKPSEQTSFMKKIFNKIKEFINWLVGRGNGDYIDNLFKDIAGGKYKKASKVKSSIYKTPVYKVLKAPSTYKKAYLDANISNTIVNKVFFSAMQFKQDNGYLDDIDIKEIISNLKNTSYNPNLYTGLILELSKESMSAAKSVEDRINAISEALSIPDNIDYIIEDVNSKIKTYSFIEYDIEEDPDPDSPTELVQKANQRIGGTESLSNKLKQYINFSTELSDNLGFGYSREKIEKLINDPKYSGIALSAFTNYIDGFKLHNALEVMLVNTDREQLLDKLYYLSREHDSMFYFYKRLLKDIYNDLKKPLPNDYANFKPQLTQEELEFSPYYRMFISGYTKHKVDAVMNIQYTDGTFEIFRANLKDIKDNTVNTWKNNLSANKFMSRTPSEINDYITELQNLLIINDNLDNVDEIPDSVDRIRTILKDVFGVELSKTYIRLSLFKANKELLEPLVGKDDLVRETAELYSLYENIDYLDNNTIVGINSAIKFSGDNKILRTHLTKSKEDLEKVTDEDLGNLTSDNEGALSKLKKLAEGNSYFDISVIPSTLTNVNKEKVYTHLYPNYITTLTLALRNGIKSFDFIDKNFDEGFEYFHSFMLSNNLIGSTIEDYDLLQLHFRQIRQIPLLKDKSIREHFIKNFKAYINDGLKVQNKDTRFKGSEVAESYYNLDARGKFIFILSQYLNENQSLVTKLPNGTKIAPMTLFQNEGKQTQWSFGVPIQDFIEDSGELNGKGFEYFNYILAGEIEKVKEEYQKIINDDLTIVKNYNQLPSNKEEREKIIAKLKNTKNKQEFFETVSKFRGLKLINFEALKDIDSNLYENLILDIINGNTINTNEIIETYFNAKFKELLEELSKPSIKILIKENGKYLNNKLPKGLEDGKKVNEKELKNFLVNYIVNASSVNTLIFGDLTVNLKDPIDLFKRYAGPNAAGPSQGFKTSNVAIVEDIKKDGITTTDGQSFGSIWWYINQYLPTSGKWNHEIERIYHKILLMEDITEDEFNTLKDNGALLNPRKTSAFNINLYGKMSTAILNRKEVSYVPEADKKAFKEKMGQILPGGNIRYGTKEFNKILSELKSFYKPLPQTKELHDLLNKMETSEPIDLVLFESAVKTVKSNVNKITNPSLMSSNMNNEYLREQVVTDSVKDEIVHGTQLMQLIWSEQLNDKDVLKFKGKNITISELRDTYKSLLGDRVYIGFEKLYKAIIKGDKANYRFLLKSFESSIIEQGGDPLMLEKFSALGKHGEVPKFNLNDPSIINSFEKMFLSYVSKSVFKRKVSGHKFTLKTDYGHEVLVDSNDNPISREDFLKNPSKYSKNTSRPLKFKQDPNKSNVYYAECKIPFQLAELLNIGENGFIKSEYAEMLGIRIPTQDKHSMVYLKVVEVLPIELGPQIIMPKEIIELSGADFDIDSEFARIISAFISGDNIVSYGSYINEKDPEQAKLKAYNEYINSKKESKEVKQQLEVLNDTDKTYIDITEEIKRVKREIALTKLEDSKDPNLKKLKKDLRDLKTSLDSAKFKNLSVALMYFGYPSNIDEFKIKYGKQIENNIKHFNNNQTSLIKPITMQEADNYLFEIEKVFVNNTNNHLIATTPASRNEAVKFINFMYGDKLVDDPVSSTDYNTPQAVVNSSTANSVGQQNIGIAALSNVMFQYFVDNETDVYGLGEINSYGVGNSRINDFISTIITMATDNAKEQDAIRMNITPNTESLFIARLMFKNDFQSTAGLMSQPVMEEFNDLMTFKKSPIKDKKEKTDDENSDIWKELLGKYTIANPEMVLPSGLTPEVLKKAKIYNQKVTKGIELSKEDLTEDEFTAVQYLTLLEFAKYDSFTKSTIGFSKVLSLIKGLKPSIGEGIYDMFQALESLGLEIVKEGNNKYSIDHTAEYKYYSVEDPDKFPVDYKKIFDNNPFLKAQVFNFVRVSELLPKFFITETPYAKNLIKDLYGEIKVRDANYDYISKLVLGNFVTETINNKNAGIFNIQDFIGSEKETTELVEMLKKLKEDPFYGSNEAIRILDWVKIEYGESDTRNFSNISTYTITMDSFKRLTPHQKSRMMDEFKLLFTRESNSEEINNIAEKFAIKLIITLMAKDLNIYRNDSYIDIIPPTMLVRFSDILDTTHDNLLNNKDFKELFGKDKTEFYEDFRTKFLLDINNNNLVKGNRIDYILNNINKGVKSALQDMSPDRRRLFLESMDKDIASAANKVLNDEKLSPEERKALYPIIFNPDGTVEINLFKGYHVMSSKDKEKDFIIIDNSKKDSGGVNSAAVAFNMKVLKSTGLFNIRFKKDGDKTKIEIKAPFVFNISEKKDTYTKNTKYIRTFEEKDKGSKNFKKGIYTATMSLGSKQVLPYAFNLEDQMALNPTEKPKETKKPEKKEEIEKEIITKPKSYIETESYQMIFDEPELLNYLLEEHGLKITQVHELIQRFNSIFDNNVEAFENYIQCSLGKLKK